MDVQLGTELTQEALTSLRSDDFGSWVKLAALCAPVLFGWRLWGAYQKSQRGLRNARRILRRMEQERHG